MQPGASRSEVAGLHDGRLKLRIAARALDGAANAALIEFLAARLGVAKRAVTLVSGARSRAKRVAAAGVQGDPERLLRAG